MRRIIGLLFLGTLAACSGTRPARFGESKFGFSAVIVRGRIMTPTGEMKDGSLAMNLEGDAERYRLKFEPGETTILRVEPDIYRIHPERNAVGMIRRDLTVGIAGRKFRVPFPRSVLRKPTVDLKPTQIIPIGILEARLLPVQKGRQPNILVTLDDSVETRRSLVEEIIDKMMDPNIPVEIRQASVSWTRALERALVQLAGEEAAKPAFKLAK